jgi:hypothetical protein
MDNIWKGLNLLIVFKREREEMESTIDETTRAVWKWQRDVLREIEILLPNLQKMVEVVKYRQNDLRILKTKIETISRELGFTGQDLMKPISDSLESTVMMLANMTRKLEMGGPEDYDLRNMLDAVDSEAFTASAYGRSTEARALRRDAHEYLSL